MVTKRKLPPDEALVCESCGAPVAPQDVILEEEWGYEGEAFGSRCSQGSTLVAVSPCCRSPLLEGGEYMPAWEIAELERERRIAPWEL